MTVTSLWSRLRKKYEPRSEQIRGMKLIVMNKGARLFLPPGKGKTSTVLKAFKILKKQDMVDVLLVLAPLRVIMTSWPAQIELWEDFEDLTYTFIHGGKTARLEAMDSNVDIYLMNVEGLLSSEWGLTKRGSHYIMNDEALTWLQGKRVMLALDESTKFKNPKATRWQTLKRYLPYIHRIVIMTGTPKPNSLEDLFGQCYLTDMGQDLGEYITHFRNEFMQLGYDGKLKPLPGALERIAERIAPTTLQLEDDEAIPVQVVDLWVKMPPEAQAIYDKLAEEFLVEIGDSTIMAPTSAALLGKLRQVAQGAIYSGNGEFTDELNHYEVVHEVKLDVLENLLEELNGDPAFLLYQFKHDVARIGGRLGGPIPYIGSGVSASQGAAWCQSFGAGGMPLLAGHPSSVAHGVDGLQNNCRNVIWFGMDWSWENYYQANKRIARDGTKAEYVMVYRILVDCATEHAVLDSVEGKRSSEAQFLAYLRKYLLA
jgi:hypothetical protein